MTATEAIKELRSHSGKSQQVFATDLKMSLRAYASYEAGKTPEIKQILTLMTYAYYNKLDNLYSILHRALVEQLTPPPGFRVEATVKITRIGERK